MMVSLHIDLNLVITAVVWLILRSSSGLESSFVISNRKYLKLVSLCKFCPLTLISALMSLVLFVIRLVSCSANLHTIFCGGFVETPNHIKQFFFISC
ncbi:hypothetical protein CHS0354_004714 [Potamilus streckersoni]|uniref:Uncharacterized protein n=1 Tax=Potamilus streckersoni TaxID=2493646 RepID=A0AAE0T2W5_9BIVA|nr:hypothetical protein CHS0354_004714 [Potamilus streckersoni]